MYYIALPLKFESLKRRIPGLEYGLLMLCGLRSCDLAENCFTSGICPVIIRGVSMLAWSERKAVDVLGCLGA
jgi:hypothetical protein